jgi:DNA-binding LacI/PurR family transcriptional regulator
MPATLRDIARKCKVSHVTVSRVVNNNGYVKEDTRKKIIETIKDFDYNPGKNSYATNHSKTRLLGLVCPLGKNWPSPYYERARNAMNGYLQDKGYKGIMYNDEEMEKLTAEDTSVFRKHIHCDGLIFFSPRGNWEPCAKAVHSWGMPCVLVRRRAHGTGIPSITDNDHKGMRQLLDHLYGLGHRQLCYFSNGIKSDRYRAFEDFINEKSMASPGSGNYFNYTLDDQGLINNFDSFFTSWMQSYSKPGVIVCEYDMIAMMVINELHKRGYKVPDNVAVTGYNDDYHPGLIYPALTTVHIPVEEMIKLACKVLLGFLDGTESAQVSIELENRLVVRESCGAGKMNVVTNI